MCWQSNESDEFADDDSRGTHADRGRNRVVDDDASIRRATNAAKDIGLRLLVIQGAEDLIETLSECGCVRTALAGGSDNRPRGSADHQTTKLMRGVQTFASLLSLLDEESRLHAR